ncbi:MAG: hypothetical protein C0511_12340 [Hyphomicrobium sp.]|nr:hypothetical protein [Hyphomicrobium sp.]
MPKRPTVLIAGLGAGLGISLARTFALAGYDVVGLSRSARLAPVASSIVQGAGGSFVHYATDLADADATDGIVKSILPVEVVVHTAHTLLIKPIEATTPQEFEAVWRAGCLSAMTVARAVVPSMVERGRGCIIFTGATASVKGGALFPAFASAKFALRGLAQSLARDLAPKGVHVAHVILDGLIDEPQSTERFGEARSQRMAPDAVSNAYLELARQQSSAWSHEIDLRPYTEKF